MDGTYTYMDGQFLWMFPKIGVPPNHPFLIEFSIINHPFWGTPVFGNTHMGNVWSISLGLSGQFMK